MEKINASIVLYNNKKEDVLNLIYSLLNTRLKIKVYLIDNSTSDKLKELSKLDDRLEYIFNNSNLGYGRAHNIAIKESIRNNVKYHIVINPDVIFDSTVIESIYNFMEENNDVGNVMPKVLYPDGKVQRLCKMLPTPLDLIVRRFIHFKYLQKRINEIYELHRIGYDKILNVPNLSGCFMFLRVEAIKEVGLFDENFFLYFEDLDLNRRIHYKYKTIYYPKVEIIHKYNRESYKNIILLFHHIKSAIYYFNKWGWFFDRERKQINKQILNNLNLKIK
ncbi:MAG: glycosyltransferase family 2 protein [Nitrososphaerota archaeon]